MAPMSLSFSLNPPFLYHKKSTSSSHNNTISCSSITSLPDQRYCDRRSLLMAAGMLALSFSPSKAGLAQEVPQNYTAFVDKADGYSYVYPSDWRNFDYTAHDSAFKDRYYQLHNVRLSFLPTDKEDIHDLGPMETVVRDLVNTIYAAPNQVAYIKDMQERSDKGKNYYTVEYQLTSPIFSVSRFTTLAIANGRFYNLTVVANERRWKRYRNKLKVVADSFEVFDI